MKREGRCGRLGCQRVVDRRCRGESKAVRADSTAGAVGSAASVKITRRLIPFMFVLYVVAFPDRINVGFADVLPPILPLRDAEQPAPGAHRGAGPDRADPDHLGDNLDGDIPRAGCGELPRPAVFAGGRDVHGAHLESLPGLAHLAPRVPDGRDVARSVVDHLPGLNLESSELPNGWHLHFGVCAYSRPSAAGCRGPYPSETVRSTHRSRDAFGCEKAGAPIGPGLPPSAGPCPLAAVVSVREVEGVSSSSEPGRIGCRRAPTCLPTGEA